MTISTAENSCQIQPNPADTSKYCVERDTSMEYVVLPIGRLSGHIARDDCSPPKKDLRDLDDSLCI